MGRFTTRIYFYLYHNPATDKFEYIPFDLDNTYGIDWFGKDWANRNLYQWANTSEPRPLYTRLMAVPAYRAEFSYYVDQLLQTAFHPSNWFPRIDSLRDQIILYAQADNYRTLDYGYTFADFQNAYTQALGAHVPYGLKPFISARHSSATSQLDSYQMRPAGSQLTGDLSIVDSLFSVRCWVEDEFVSGLTVEVHYQFDQGTVQSIAMNPSGTHTWTGQFQVPSIVDTIHYWVEAQDIDQLMGRSPVCEAAQFITRPAVPTLVINEVMASNESWAIDEYGEWEDWIEIYNPGTVPVALGDLFLTDDPALRDRWQLPNMTLLPKEYVLIWADKQAWQGDRHSNFKLASGGEFVGLYASRAQHLFPIDTFSFPSLDKGESYGRLPNGTGPLQILPFATPETINDWALSVTPFQETNIQVFPNPTTHQIQVHWEQASPAEIEVLALNGQVLAEHRVIVPLPKWISVLIRKDCTC